MSNLTDKIEQACVASKSARESLLREILADVQALEAQVEYSNAMSTTIGAELEKIEGELLKGATFKPGDCVRIKASGVEARVHGTTGEGPEPRYLLSEINAGGHFWYHTGQIEAVRSKDKLHSNKPAPDLVALVREMIEAERDLERRGLLRGVLASAMAAVDTK